MILPLLHWEPKLGQADWFRNATVGQLSCRGSGQQTEEAAVWHDCVIVIKQFSWSRRYHCRRPGSSQLHRALCLEWGQVPSKAVFEGDSGHHHRDNTEAWRWSKGTRIPTPIPLVYRTVVATVSSPARVHAGVKYQRETCFHEAARCASLKLQSGNADSVSAYTPKMLNCIMASSMELCCRFVAASTTSKKVSWAKSRGNRLAALLSKIWALLSRKRASSILKTSSRFLWWFQGIRRRTGWPLMRA